MTELAVKQSVEGLGAAGIKRLRDRMLANAATCRRRAMLLSKQNPDRPKMEGQAEAWDFAVNLLDVIVSTQETA